VDAATLAKIGELVKGIEAPASSLAREDAGVLAQQVVEATEDAKALATSEAGKMLMVVSAAEGVQGDKAAGSEVAAPEAVTDILDSPHSHSVVEVESYSTQSSSYQSTSSSSATDYDDVPLGKLYPTTQKGQSSTTRTHKKPKTNISQEPVRSDIDDRIIGLSQRKADFYDRFPVSTNPLRPPMIQPLNMVPSDENIEPSSSSHPQIIKPLSIVDPTVTIESSSHLSSPEQTQNTTVLAIWFVTTLVNYQHSEKAYEVASMEVASESPQHQSPNQQMTTTISPAHVSSSEHVSTSEHVSIPEPVVPEHIVPEQLAPEHTFSSTIPEYIVPGQVLKPYIPETINEPDNIIK
jgi:hypothetical protein